MSAFQEKLEKFRQINRQFEDLRNCLGNAQNNLQSFGYIPTYKTQYEAEVKKLQDQLQEMIDQHPHLASY